jgi:hypothetical protein
VKDINGPEEGNMSQEDVFHIDEDSKPYTHLNFKNDPDEFQFVIVSDNAGGARPGVLDAALGMVNLLQPEQSGR